MRSGFVSGMDREATAESLMTLTVDVSEVAARLQELLAEAEAGGQVVIMRGTEPVAKIEKAIRVPKSFIEEMLLRKELELERDFSRREFM